VGIRLRRSLPPVARLTTAQAAAAAGCAALAGLSGCAEAAADPPAPAPLAPAAATEWPASVAGGACQLLDYATIEAAIKVRFDVAAASQQGKTYTCVVQHSDAARPDLTLAVTASTADPATFRSTMVPAKAQPVTGLGKAAYRAGIAGSTAQGAAVEVGWLSADKRLLTLRFTFPPGAAAAAVDGLAPQLVELAKKIDKTRPG
jgi:hypothetical protein